MDVLWLCILVAVTLPGALPKTDLYGKAFVLPTESDTAYVSLPLQRNSRLKAFTLCLHFYSDLQREYGLFSYAIRGQDNEILLFRDKFRRFLLEVGRESVYFPSPPETGAPLHLCATWESASGIAEVWVDGKPLARKSLKKGYLVGNEASIVLGQDQDSFGGGFEKTQSLVGDIGNVNMWDFVLSPEEIRVVAAGGTFSPNVLDWRALEHMLHGEVYIRPQLWPEGLS